MYVFTRSFQTSCGISLRKIARAFGFNYSIEPLDLDSEEKRSRRHSDTVCKISARFNSDTAQIFCLHEINYF